MLQDAVTSRALPYLRYLKLEDMQFCLPLFVDAIAPFSKFNPARAVESYTDADELRRLILESFRAIPDSYTNDVAMDAFRAAVHLIETMGIIRLKRDEAAREHAAA
jgi:hypothetical protein